MTHCRDLALDRLVENFGAVVGVGGIRQVLKTKVWNLDSEDLPVLGVYFANELVQRASGHHRGQRIVKRTMNFFAVGVFAKPMRTVNSLEADQGAVMGAVEAAVAADPSLSRDGAALLSDLHVTQAGTGYDAEGAAVTVALAATSLVAVAHHVEGRPDLTLAMANR